jgi:hypothetical protein
MERICALLPEAARARANELVFAVPDELSDDTDRDVLVWVKSDPGRLSLNTTVHDVRIESLTIRNELCPMTVHNRHPGSNGLCFRAVHDCGADDVLPPRHPTRRPRPVRRPTPQPP